MIRMLSHSGWVNAETSDKEQLRHMLVPPGASLPGWSGHLPAGPRPLLPRRPTLSRVQGHRGSSWPKCSRIFFLLSCRGFSLITVHYLLCVLMSISIYFEYLKDLLPLKWLFHR